MKFVFRIRTDAEEAPAARAAKQAAGLLRERGHEVRIVNFPQRLSYLRLFSRNAAQLTRDRVDAFFRKRMKEIFSLHRLGRKDKHVIDFHNADENAFFTSERKKLEEYTASVGSLEASHVASNPLTLLLHDEASNGRLVATLELPAVRKKMSGRILPARVREVAKHIDALGLSEVDMGIDFQRKFSKPTYFSMAESQKAGYLDPKFIGRIARELERLAREEEEYVARNPKQKRKPHRLLEVDTRTKNELFVASQARQTPMVLRPEKVRKKLNEAERRLTEFDAHYKANASRLFDEDPQELARLNRKREVFLKAVDEAEMLWQTAQAVQAASREISSSPEKIYRKYGRLPHFARKR